MTSTRLMQGLVMAYVLIALTAAWESNWWRVLYWCSAAGITIAVIGGTK